MKDYNRYEDAAKAFTEYYDEMGSVLPAHHVAEAREMSIAVMCENFITAHHEMIESAIMDSTEETREAAEHVRVTGSVLLCEIMSVLSTMTGDDAFSEFADMMTAKLRSKVDRVRGIMEGITGTPNECREELARRLYAHVTENGNAGNASTGMYI